MARAERLADQSATSVVSTSSYVKLWKRCVDLILSTGLLTVAILPMLVVALLIRIESPGNPLFLQKRVGRDGRQFTMWKFRTMVASDPNQIQLLRDADGELRHKIRKDPRVTGVGRILRKTSLDELPQLVNVLWGTMSLVGPRPELPMIVEHYESWQHRRHDVRPGITGWWQVSGRSDLPMHENTELDIFYVDNVSWRLDLQIVKKTITGVLRGVGAF